MTKEKQYIIYDLILKGEKLTLKKLYSYGISKFDIEEMVQVKNIDKIGENEYIISSNESLYSLGLSLTNNREYDRGIKYLEKYYETNPSNKEVKLVLINVYLNRKEFEKIFPIIDELLKTDNKKEQKDCLLILYLLSIICPYPEKYKDKILNLTYDDILYTNEDYSKKDIQYHNQMRTRVMQNKLYQSKVIFDTHIINTYKSKAEKELLKKLLEDAKYMDNKRNEALEQYAKEKQYQNIISFIEKKKDKTRLSLGDELIYKITKDIIRINETNKIPRPRITEAANVKIAIEGKNYYLALKLNGANFKEISDYNIRKTISILLIDINKMISSILKEYKERLDKGQNKSEENNQLTKKRIK